ncbi:MAG: transcription antitermination factor NusB [Spirochaetales bacterium]|jgi:N utilization substance protein B|nr:transcription antitermination factor NusB [Spirochaetales bacterium]
MGPRRKGRILAVQALFAYDFTHCGVSDLTHFSWAQEKDSEDVDESIQNFASLLTAGAIGNMKAIDELISKHLEHWDFSRLNRIDLAILRVSVYSFLFLRDIPASVVIDEAVDIAKDFGTDESYRFINGVLDGIRKALENHESP